MSIVEPETPYNVSEDILDKYDCQYYAHGDDPCYGADGVDMCSYLDSKGKFK